MARLVTCYFILDLYAMEMNQMVIGGDTTRSAFEGKRVKIVCFCLPSKSILIVRIINSKVE